MPSSKMSSSPLMPSPSPSPPLGRCPGLVWRSRDDEGGLMIISRLAGDLGRISFELSRTSTKLIRSSSDSCADPSSSPPLGKGFTKGARLDWPVRARGVCGRVGSRDESLPACRCSPRRTASDPNSSSSISPKGRIIVARGSRPREAGRDSSLSSSSLVTMAIRGRRSELGREADGLRDGLRDEPPALGVRCRDDAGREAGVMGRPITNGQSDASSAPSGTSSSASPAAWLANPPSSTSPSAGLLAGGTSSPASPSAAGWRWPATGCWR